MTEGTLEQAIEIKGNIDQLRKRKDELERQRSLCRGNTSEVRARGFQISIKDGSAIKTVDVNPDSVIVALEQEIKRVEEALTNYLSDLADLN